MNLPGERLDGSEWGTPAAKPAFIAARSGSLQVWDWPTAKGEYVIGADAAEGRVRDMGARKIKPGTDLMFRDRPDYSAIIVIERESGRHVATWHGYLEPTQWAAVLVAIGRHYNTALIVPEINGPGAAAIDVMVRVFRYPKLYRRKVWGRDLSADWSTGEWGWSTQTNTRHFLIQRVHEWLKGAPKTRDAGLVRELRTMEVNPRTGEARAMGKHKDDRVMALGMALQGRYEVMHGSIGAESPVPDSRLDGYDRRVWDHIQRQQERSDRARKLASGSSRQSRPLPRSRGS